MFLGKCRNFVGRRVKKGRSKFRLKFGPPVCEVLDPLDPARPPSREGQSQFRPYPYD